jgi:uncharacterized membrane protein
MRTGIIVSTLCFIFLAAGTLSGCYYDKEDLLYHKTGAVDCTTINAKFSTGVQPIIQSKCATAGCHNAASSAGGAVLETYTQISGLAARINQRCVIDKTMPPGGALTPDEIAILSCWISSGTLNN